MVCVCLCVWLAMRFFMLQGMGLKLGMGIWDGPTRLNSIFSKWPHQRSNVMQRSNCLRNVPWQANVVTTTPDRNVVHCWGQRSHRGHLGSARGQIVQECPVATKFSRNTFDQSVVHWWGQRSCRGQPGSNCSRICSRTKFDRKNPWPMHAGVRQGQPRPCCSGMPYVHQIW